MPGKLVTGRIKLDKAMNEGFRGDPPQNPHEFGSPAYEAYELGKYAALPLEPEPEPEPESEPAPAPPSASRK